MAFPRPPPPGSMYTIFTGVLQGGGGGGKTGAQRLMNATDTYIWARTVHFPDRSAPGTRREINEIRATGPRIYTPMLVGNSRVLIRMCQCFTQVQGCSFLEGKKSMRSLWTAMCSAGAPSMRRAKPEREFVQTCLGRGRGRNASELGAPPKECKEEGESQHPRGTKIRTASARGGEGRGRGTSAICAAGACKTFHFRVTARTEACVTQFEPVSPGSNNKQHVARNMYVPRQPPGGKRWPGRPCKTPSRAWHCVHLGKLPEVLPMTTRAGQESGKLAKGLEEGPTTTS